MLDLHARISVNAMQNAETKANLPKQFVTVVKMTDDSDSGENECDNDYRYMGYVEDCRTLRSVALSASAQACA